MNRLILLLLTFLSTTSYTQNVSMNWVSGIGGTQQEVSKAIATDGLGNVYTCGYFTGTADFDPSANIFNLTSIGMQDIFIMKLDINGNFVWAKRFGGIGNDMASNITIDVNSNVYTCGFFRNTVDFDPGLGNFTLSAYSSSSQDIFISKFDTNGNFTWVRTFGGSGYIDSLGNTFDAVSSAYGICTDAIGNIYTTGSFLGAIDFDSGTNNYLLNALQVPNIFVSKLSSNGHFIWAKSMGENKKGDEAYAIALDAMSNVYTTGVFSDTADFDPSPLVYSLIATSLNAVFVSKLDSSGNFVWAKQIAGNSYNDQGAGYSIVIATDGKIIIGGHFKGTIDSDPSTSSYLLSSNGNYDIFICKLDTNGNFIWANGMGDLYADYCYKIDVDAFGDVYASGSFKGKVDFNSGIDTFSLSAFSVNTDGYILKLNTNGNFLNASQFGGLGNDGVNAITVHQNGQLVSTGYFSGIADFDPNQSSSTLSAIGSLDAFVLSLNQSGMILPICLRNFSGIPVTTGNLLKWAIKNDINAAYVEIEKSIDAVHFDRIGIVECFGLSTDVTQYSFLDNKITEPTNFYRLKLIDHDKQFSYSHLISLSNNMDENKLVLYPNPNGGNFTLRLSSAIKNKNIMIRNTDGEIVHELKNVSGTIFSIDLSNQSNGTYYLEIVSNEINELKNKNELSNRTKIQVMR